eukprot:UN25448
MFSGYVFLLFISIANICKCLCGVAAGTTRIAILNHFALKDNVTDLSAKEGIQETFVTVCGMILGMAVTHNIGESPKVTWFLFISLMLVHIYANYVGVRCLKLKTLDQQRLHIILKHWHQTKTLLTIEQVRLEESIV